MKGKIRGDRFDPVSIGKRIRNRRRQLGISQRELAAQTEVNGGSIVTYAYVSRIEQGTRTPSIASLIAMARVLHVTPEWLALGEPLPDACVFCQRTRRQR